MYLKSFKQKFSNGYEKDLLYLYGEEYLMEKK